MSKFKVGDKVRRVKGVWNKMETGDIGTVRLITPYGGVGLEEYRGIHSRKIFELVEKSNRTPHVHCEAIKAWADGYEVQCKDGYEWETVTRPSWTHNFQYRIKPNSPNQAKIEMLQKKLEEVKQEMEDLKGQ